MPQVRLTTLPVLRRYALATRQEWADAEVLQEVLEESLREVRLALGRGRESGRRESGGRESGSREDSTRR